MWRPGFCSDNVWSQSCLVARVRQNILDTRGGRSESEDTSSAQCVEAMHEFIRHQTELRKQARAILRQGTSAFDCVARRMRIRKRRVCHLICRKGFLNVASRPTRRTASPARRPCFAWRRALRVPGLSHPFLSRACVCAPGPVKERQGAWQELDRQQ